MTCADWLQYDSTLAEAPVLVHDKSGLVAVQDNSAHMTVEARLQCKQD